MTPAPLPADVIAVVDAAITAAFDGAPVPRQAVVATMIVEQLADRYLLVPRLSDDELVAAAAGVSTAVWRARHDGAVA